MTLLSSAYLLTLVTWLSDTKDNRPVKNLTSAIHRVSSWCSSLKYCSGCRCRTRAKRIAPDVTAIIRSTISFRISGTVAGVGLYWLTQSFTSSGSENNISWRVTAVWVPLSLIQLTERLHTITPVNTYIWLHQITSTEFHAMTLLSSAYLLTLVTWLSDMKNRQLSKLLLKCTYTHACIHAGTKLVHNPHQIHSRFDSITRYHQPY